MTTYRSLLTQGQCYAPHIDATNHKLRSMNSSSIGSLTFFRQTIIQYLPNLI